VSHSVACFILLVSGIVSTFYGWHGCAYLWVYFLGLIFVIAKWNLNDELSAYSSWLFLTVLLRIFNT